MLLSPDRRSSTRASVISHANSSYSLAGSTRHMLADTNNSSTSDSTTGLLEPPNAPFAGKRTPDSLSLSSGKGSSLSLSVNYVPNKFSSSIVSPVGARFRGAKSNGPSLKRTLRDARRVGTGFCVVMKSQRRDW